jgi:hypothetical protein
MCGPRSYPQRLKPLLSRRFVARLEAVRFHGATNLLYARNPNARAPWKGTAFSRANRHGVREWLQPPWHSLDQEFGVVRSTVVLKFIFADPKYPAM